MQKVKLTILHGSLNSFKVVTDDVANKVPAGCWEECMNLDEGKLPPCATFLIKRNRYQPIY
jgi:hypothetical protein